VKRYGLNKKILILGAGFGGLQAARALAGRASAMVIDRRSHFDFLANIHELVSGSKTPEVLRLPNKEVIERWGHEFVLDEVEQIDGSNRRVHTKTGRVLDYDVLLLALGGEDASFGVPNVDRYAYAFKSVDDCHRIGLRLAELSGADRPYHVVIVGGGLEGIESLGEIMRRYRGDPNLHVSLVEGNVQLLPVTSEVVDRRIRELTRDYAVEFFTGERVKKIRPKSVLLESGLVLKSDLTIWTGGLAPAGLLHRSGLTARPGAWMPADQTLQNPDFPEIFILGDIIDMEKPVEKQAYHAMDMGLLAAENVLRHLSGKSLKRFKPATKPMLVSFGDLTCFLIFGNTVIHGPSLNLLKEFIYHSVMAQYDLRPRPMPAYRMLQRIGSTFDEVVLPTVSSWERLKRMGRMGVLSWF